MRHVVFGLDFVLVCVAVLCSHVNGLQIDDGRYESEASLEKRFGRRYLQLKNLPEVPLESVVLAWDFPTNIVSEGTVYHVERTTVDGDFEISSLTNSVVLASGTVTRMSSARYARVCGCGLMAASNQGVAARVLQTAIRPLDSRTNNFYISNLKLREDGEEVLVYNNLLISIQGTNKYCFARALLNAGLPDGIPKLLPTSP